MRRSGGLLAMAVVAGMAVTLASCSSGGNASDGNEANPSSTTTTMPSVGAARLAPDGSIVETSFYGPDQGGGTTAPKSGDSLISVTVYGCSPKNGSASFNPQYFSLKMKDNSTAPAALGTVTSQIVSTKVSGGKCAFGKVGFDVAPGQVPATLIFNPPNSNGRLEWKIGATAG